MAKVICKHCGFWLSGGDRNRLIQKLVREECRRNPYGRNHQPYEGPSEITSQENFTCKHCGWYIRSSNPASAIQTLTREECRRNPNGRYHELL